MRSLLLLAVMLSGSMCASAALTSDDNDIADLYARNAEGRIAAFGRLEAKGPSLAPRLVPVICDRNKRGFDRAWPLAARLVAKWKSTVAAPCLVELLMYTYPSIGPVEMKSDSTLKSVDPAFAALIEIGDSAIPAIRERLRFLGPDPALMALKALRAIGTPAAREAADAYLSFLKDQLRSASSITADMDR